MFRKIVHSLILFCIFSLTMVSASTQSKENNLTDEQLHAVMEIITNFILSDDTLDTTKPVITLNGSSMVTLSLGDAFVEAGAIASDDRDGNLTNKIVIKNEINSSEAGTYTVTYNVTDRAGNKANEVSRVVKVIKGTIPVISFGDKPIEKTVNIGQEFYEFGYTATDKEDGDLTAKIKLTGDAFGKIEPWNIAGYYTVLAPKATGDYNLTYSVTDSDGNRATKVRCIHVNKIFYFDESKTKNQIILKLGEPFELVTQLFGGEGQDVSYNLSRENAKFLTFDKTTKKLYGTPQAAGFYNARLKAAYYLKDWTEVSTYMDIKIKVEVPGKRNIREIKNISVDTVKTANVEVLNSVYKSHPVGSSNSFKASSITFEKKDGKWYINNAGFTTIKSLYVYDGTNYRVLQFDKPIERYTVNEIKKVDGYENISFYKTSGAFDASWYFAPNSNECTASDKDTQEFCAPLDRGEAVYSDKSGGNSPLSEKDFFSVALAKFHHFYNIAESYDITRSWSFSKNYNYHGKIIDLTNNSCKMSLWTRENKPNGEEGIEEFAAQNFMRLTMPNRKEGLLVWRYEWGTAQGVALMRGLQKLGDNSFINAWLAEVESGVDGSPDYQDIVTIHHEYAHTLGYRHESGFTYGYSNALGAEVLKILDEIEGFTSEQANEELAPKYIYTTKELGNNKWQLTLYGTDNIGELHFDILTSFFAKDGDVKVERRDEDKDNQITLTINPEKKGRVYLRVWGDGSREIMSSFIEFMN